MEAFSSFLDRAGGDRDEFSQLHGRVGTCQNSCSRGTCHVRETWDEKPRREETECGDRPRSRVCAGLEWKRGEAFRSEHIWPMHACYGDW